MSYHLSYSKDGTILFYWFAICQVAFHLKLTEMTRPISALIPRIYIYSNFPPFSAKNCFVVVCLQWRYKRVLSLLHESNISMSFIKLVISDLIPGMITKTIFKDTRIWSKTKVTNVKSKAFIEILLSWRYMFSVYSTAASSPRLFSNAIFCRNIQPHSLSQE